MFYVAAVVAGALGLGYLSLKRFFPWILKDIQYLSMVVPSVLKMELIRNCGKGPFLVDIFEQKAAQQPDKVFVIFEDKTYTYKFMNEQANRVAHAALMIGIKRGHTVAMMNYNEPAFLWTLLGFLKIGVTVALINVNQRSKTLLHSFEVAGAKYIIIGEGKDLTEAVAEVLDDLPGTCVYVQGSSKEKLSKNFKSFHDIMIEMPFENIAREVRKDMKPSDVAVYVYTSGTTGLPKAALFSQRKLFAGIIVMGSVRFSSDDILMVCLPLYHSSALALGVTAVIINGASMILCRKFSASTFWNDCRRHKATSFNYIGELCRYLMAKPPSDAEKQHNIRVAIGNGLREDIFQDFQRRFAIPWIAEFYASTEGPTGFINCLNVPSSCGRHSPLLNKFLFAEIVKFDMDKEEPVRNNNGFCIPVKRHERGLLLSKITNRQIYEGYKGKKDLSDSRIVRNVVKEGDTYFNTGDLFTLGAEYDLYFNDRIGDTFRWKGENVSTTEVSNILTDLEFITDACVYGVRVPGQDGKAGMAVLTLRQELTSLDEDALLKLSKHCLESFPGYERPIFLRLSPNLEMTSTLKQNKIQYKEEGFDKTRIQDDMFYFDKDEKTYKPLTHNVYKDIIDKNMKL